jgi:serine phosphatase RsbU (regulator of sigma subunit)
LRSFFITLAVIVASLGSYFRVFELYELQTYDWRCQMRGARPVSSEIVLIDIWDDTVRQFGAWPFDREYHAKLIDFLSDVGVKALAFDILFIEEKPSDAKVVTAAKAAGNVYFPFSFPQPKPKDGIFIADSVQSAVLTSYAKAAKGYGFVNAKADIDGKRRRMMPIISYQGKDYYQLSFRVIMDVFGIKPEDVKVVPGRELVLSKDLTIPLDDEGYFIINYAGQWETTFKHYSYLDVLASYMELQSGQKPRINLEELRGKICFVGLTSVGSHDTSPVPIQSVYPMVGAYANIINTILNKDFIRRLDRVWNVLILLIAGFFVYRFSSRAKPVRALLMTLGVLSVLTAAVLTAFIFWGLWVDLFYPLAAIMAVYIIAVLNKVLFEIKKRELIENELKIASKIQKSFLPETPPIRNGLSLAVYMKPAKAVGGDLYAFMTPNAEKTGVMVGDVSGKGTPAALFMAKVVSEFKFSARDKMDPAEILSALNDSISSESTGGLFVTVSYVIFDRSSKKMLLSNGGHLPVISVKAGGETAELVSEEGMPIGVMPGMTFADAERPIEEGEVFAFYSDGVSEARNRKKEEYGIPALTKIILDNRNMPADEILKIAVEDLNRFMGKADQHDDITLIIVKINPWDTGL